MTPRPQRQRKSDRLMTPAASPAEIACDHAVAPFDRVAREMDRRWGVDRLPELVSPATAARYGAAMAHLNAMIDAADPARTAEAAQNCIRGMQAMDAEAQRLGHRPGPAEVLIHDEDGLRFGIVRDPGDHATLQADHPGLTLYSLREIGIMVRHYQSPAVEAAKAAFRGAEVVALRPARSKLAEELNDEIPF